jgi:ribosomal protein S12 methylthiotransferase accessory factor
VLKRGLVEDEERPDIHNMLGVCYFKKKEHEAAVFHFKRAVDLNPASGIDYANLGVNYSRMGKKDEAVEYFTVALTLDPSLDFARNELAVLMAEEKS